MCPKKTKSSTVRLVTALHTAIVTFTRILPYFSNASRLFQDDSSLIISYHHPVVIFLPAEETYDATVTVEREFLPPAHLCPSLGW